MAEMLNTALEEVTDLITVKWSHQAKVVKDVAAAISLVSAITSVIVGFLIFAPYIGWEFI
jgi:diacylglycerol kinase